LVDQYPPEPSTGLTEYVSEAYTWICSVVSLHNTLTPMPAPKSCQRYS